MRRLALLVLVTAPALASAAAAEAPRMATRPAEVFGPVSAAKASLAAKFRDAAQTDADSAGAAALEYLAAPPWDPAAARDMKAWLSAREALRASGELSAAGQGLEERLAQMMDSLTAAVPGSVEIHVTDHEMIPGNAVPVLSHYETHVWTYEKPETRNRCGFAIAGKLTQRTDLSLGRAGESARDPLDFDIRATWDLAALAPQSVRIEAGSVIQAKVAQREVRGPLGGGHRKVRAVSPEYFVVSMGPEGGVSPQSAEALVFADESAARNVAVQLMQASIVCHQLFGALPAPRGKAPEVKLSLAPGGRRIDDPPVAVVGDEWEFATRAAASADSPAASSSTKKSVTEVSAGRIVTREETSSSGGSSVVVGTRDRDWNLVSSSAQTYDFPVVDHLFPFGPGMSWHQRTRAVPSDDPASPSVDEVDTQVLGWERVTVPAGSWDALKVRRVTKPQTPGEPGVAELVTTSWYVAEVKSEVRIEWANGVTELTSFKVTAAPPDTSRREEEAARAAERLKAVEEEEKRLALEAEERKKTQAEEKQRLALEAAERKKLEAEERQRLAIEAAERKKAEAEEKRRLAREEAERKKAEAAEKKRLALEDAARKKAEAEEAKHMDAETRLLVAKARQLEAEVQRMQAGQAKDAPRPTSAVSTAGTARLPARTLEEAKADPRFRVGAVVEDAKVRVLSAGNGYPYFGISENGCSAGKSFVTAELLAPFDGLTAGTTLVLRLENPSPGATAMGAALAFPTLRRAGKGKDGTFVYCGKGTAFPVRR